MKKQGMNAASQWRFVLATRIAPVYADNTHVRVVEVGGSVSRGCADRYSDVEIGVFWVEPPTEEWRQKAAISAGGEEWRSYAFEHEEWSEEYTVQGVKIDVSHRLVASMEGWLGDVVDHCETTVVKQNLIAAIQYALPLHGASLLERWQLKIRDYPDGLAEAMVRENIMLGPQQWLEMLAERVSVIELYSLFCTIEKKLLGVLMGLNRVYHPGFKWLDRLIADLSLAPLDLAVRFGEVFRQDPQDGVQEVQALIEETYALVNRLMPQIDLAPAQARLTQRRQLWEQSPHIPH